MLPRRNSAAPPRTRRVSSAPRSFRRWSGVVALAAVLCALSGCEPAPVQEQEDVRRDVSSTPTHIQLVSIAEWAAQIDPVSEVAGAAHLAGYWLEDRKAYPDATLVLSSGDSFGVSPPLSSFFQEEPAIIALNAMGFDIDTFGNHNFDRGLPHLQRMIDLAEFRYVVANFTNVPQNLRGVAPYTVRSLDGVPVAIIGVVDPAAPDLVFPGSFGTMDLSDPVAAALEARAMAADAGATVFVLLAHLWSAEVDGAYQGPIIDMARALQAASGDGFALIIGESASNGQACAVVGDGPPRCLTASRTTPTSLVDLGLDGTLIVQNRSKGRTYSRVILQVVPATGEVLDRRIEFVVPYASHTGVRCSAPEDCLSGTCGAGLCRCRATSECPDGFDCAPARPQTEGSGDTCQALGPLPVQAVEDVIRDYRTELAVAFDARLATTPATFDADEAKVRTEQLPIGSLIADAMREHADAQIAFMNGGGIRAPLPSDYRPEAQDLRRPPGQPPYDIVRGDVHEMLPFVNVVMRQQATGKELWAAFENSVQYINQSGAVPEQGVFLHVSGVRLTYDAAAPPLARVCTVVLDDGTPVANDSVRYSIATNDFLAQGGDGYISLTNDQGIALELLTDVVTDFLGERGAISPADFADDPPRVSDVAGDRSRCVTP